MPLFSFLGHEDARCPLLEHTKQDAKGRGLSGFSGFLHRDNVCLEEPQLKESFIQLREHKLIDGPYR